jgi:AcrR family transcriptional regulator
MSEQRARAAQPLMAATSDTPAKPGSAREQPAKPGSTRERILDIALELFTEHGYDKTSLQNIADRLGTTKAALYYHFKSKSAILLELHLRLHDLGAGFFDELEALPDGAARVAAWPVLLDRLIDTVDANHELIALHQRNQSAFEELHREQSDPEVFARHEAANDDIGAQFQRLFASPDIPPADRVRMACSIGAVLFGLLGSSTLLDGIPPAQVTSSVRAVVAEMFSG